MRKQDCPAATSTTRCRLRPSGIIICRDGGGAEVAVAVELAVAAGFGGDCAAGAGASLKPKLASLCVEE